VLKNIHEGILLSKLLVS